MSCRPWFCTNTYRVRCTQGHTLQRSFTQGLVCWWYNPTRRWWR